MQTIITHSFNQTQNLGKEFAKKLPDGNIVALYGNLGSGKTTFVQGFAKVLEIKSKIISPTFIIIRKYEIPASSSSEYSESRSNNLTIQQFNNFYHIDLYRVESEKDIQGLGLEEILKDDSNVVVIEWPEKIEKLLPKETIKINFKYLDDYKRQITYNIAH